MFRSFVRTLAVILVSFFIFFDIKTHFFSLGCLFFVSSSSVSACSFCVCFGGGGGGIN